MINELKNHLLNNLEQGAWRFGPRLPATDVRIPASALHTHAKQWSQLLVELMMQNPTGGLLGEPQLDNGDEFSWLTVIDQQLQQIGAEIGVSEQYEGTSLINTYGELAENYPSNFPLSVFSAFNMLGGRLRYLKRRGEKNGLRIISAFTLIDRSPEAMTEVDGIPLHSVLHLPLPLYRTDREVPFGFPINRTKVLFS